MRIPCPSCRGHGFESHKPCILCAGRSFVDTEQVCTCGRPAVKIAGGTVVCFSDYCYDRAIKPIEVTANNGMSIVDNMTESERLEFYKERFGFF